jgi:predicted cation transporter
VASVSVASSVASLAAAASPAAAKCDDAPTQMRAVDEYPPVVQEMVMNGFEIAKVVRAVELIGENFDDVLAFLMSNTS